MAPRSRPGSPWMPTPSSTSFSASSNPGFPAAGTVPACNAMAKERVRSFTRVAMAATASRSAPSSAAAPAIFSTMTVPPTPRRPAVKVESSTAASSSVTTLTTRMSSSSASSAAIRKLRTSPV